MKQKINQKELNATLVKHSVTSKGKTYENLILLVQLNNGEVVSFEITPKFYNRKFVFKLKQNLNEVN